MGLVLPVVVDPCSSDSRIRDPFTRGVDLEQLFMELGELGNRFELGGGRRTLLRGPGEGLLAFDLFEPEVRILVLGDRDGGCEECDQDCEQEPLTHDESPSLVFRGRWYQDQASRSLSKRPGRGNRLV
jgi:hypothetical protein